MKIPKLIRRKKLRASTARRSLTMPAEMDYEEMSEPNMKLSRALLIVLVLHVVAVAGIIAFNTIKTRQGSVPTPAVTKNVHAKMAEVPPPNVAAPPQAESAAAHREEVKAAHSNLAKEERKTEHAKQTADRTVSDPGKVYVVAKGDNPVTIARKLKVPYDSLLQLNHIDDPRKLQIGQKLLVPAKTTKKKSDE